MKNKTQKLTALCAALTLSVSALPAVSALEMADDAPRVRVTAENTVFSGDDSAAPAFTGTLFDEWVELDENDNGMTAIVKAVNSAGTTVTGADAGYITEIGGLSAGDGGEMSGWSTTLNGWFTDSAITDYSVENGELCDGDEIKMLYTTDWGLDIGCDWSGTDTSLKALDISGGTLSPAFDPAVSEYTLTLPDGTDEVHISAVPVNKYFRVCAALGDDTLRLNSKPISLSDGETLTLTVDPGEYSTAQKSVYTVGITKTEDENTSPSESDNEQNSEDTPSVTPDADEIYKMLLAAFSEKTITPLSDTNGEWALIAAARSKAVTTAQKEGYINGLEKLLSDTDGNRLSNKATDNARVVIALAAIGADPSDICGKNLIQPLEDTDFVTHQGLNGAIYALIALNCCGGSDNETAFISFILDSMAQGGWSLDGGSADADLTAMALQALAPYYTENEDVKKAADTALETLGRMLDDNCTYENGCESTAQVITALTALSSDPRTDSRFIRDGKTLTDALCSYYTDGGFAHISGGGKNDMATEQAFIALTALYLYDNGYGTFYGFETAQNDPSDTSEQTSDTVIGDTDNTEETSSTDTADSTEENGNPPTGIRTDAGVLIISSCALCLAGVLLKKKRK